MNHRDNSEIHYDGHPDPLLYELSNLNIPNRFTGEDTTELFYYHPQLFSANSYPITWRDDTIQGRLDMSERHGKLKAQVLRQMNDSLYTPKENTTDKQKRDEILELLSHLDYIDEVYNRYLCGALEKYIKLFPPNDLEFFETRPGDNIPEWAKNIGKKWLLQNEENEVKTLSTLRTNLKKVQVKGSLFIQMIIRFTSYKLLGAIWTRLFLQMLIRFIIIKCTLPFLFPFIFWLYTTRIFTFLFW